MIWLWNHGLSGAGNVRFWHHHRFFGLLIDHRLPCTLWWWIVVLARFIFNVGWLNPYWCWISTGTILSWELRYSIATFTAFNHCDGYFRRMYKNFVTLLALKFFIWMCIIFFGLGFLDHRLAILPNWYYSRLFFLHFFIFLLIARRWWFNLPSFLKRIINIQGITNSFNCFNI